MKKVFLFLSIIVWSVTLPAQTPPVPVSYEVVTLDATVGGIGFTSTTLTVNGQQVRSCSGVLENGAIRFRVDTTAPTAANGTPASVGQFIQIDGFTALSRFHGIRTTGTSGVIRFTCSR